MLKDYTRFFNHLYSHSSSLRGLLGADAEKLVALLLKQPESTGRKLGVDFEDYLIKLIRFGLKVGSIEPYFFDFLEGQGLLGKASKGMRIVLTTQPSKIKLSFANVKEIERALEVAKKVAAQIKPTPKARELLVPIADAPSAHGKGRASATRQKKRAKPPEQRMMMDDDVGDGHDGGGSGGGQGAVPPAAAGGEPSPDRQIFVTGHTLKGDTASAFKRGEKYKLRFGVGTPVAVNLATGDTAVKDVPKGGLQTHWVVTSADVEFIETTSTLKIRQIGSTSIAEFDLEIPESGNSQTKEIAFLADAKDGSVHVTIYVVASDGAREIYREVSVGLKGKPKITADETAKAVLHTHLRTSREWMTPPEHVQVSINNGVATVSTKRIRLENYYFQEPFTAIDNWISGPIDAIRDALEKFREVHETYLNDLDHSHITARLSRLEKWQPYYDRGNGWQPLPDEADAAHKAAFDQVVKSKEWQALAMAGYTLFNACFAKDSKLRALLVKLKPGSRVDFHWTRQSGAGSAAHVPWSLMYNEPVDVMRKTLADPEKFLGLRFRIGAHAHPVNNGSVVLGGLDSVHSVNLLYWGDQEGDEVATESSWQADAYKALPRASFLPDRAKPDFKNQIMSAIDAPGPSPVGVLYFYCHCSVGNGTQLNLRFGNTSKIDDTLVPADLSLSALTDAPLIFANACTTVQAETHRTSALEDSFFQRGIRAFIGTETKVPIKLASKFAWLYFQFLYRIVDSSPMAAGEALTQARMFLWTQYKNVGGLFYSMTNQYELYLASEAEVLALRE